MLGKLWAALSGYKTYLLSAGGIVIALIGHFAGPVTIGSIQIPAMSWQDFWKVVWTSGLFSALRNGVGSGNTPS